MLPGDLLPRRAVATAVVGSALVGEVGGQGHRRIAADLHRRVSTVRGWLRAARDAAHLERIDRRANQRTSRIDPDTLNRVIPASSLVGDAHPARTRSAAPHPPAIPGRTDTPPRLARRSSG